MVLRLAVRAPSRGWLLCTFIFCWALLSYGASTPTLTEDCLYFTNTNGKALIGQVEQNYIWIIRLNPLSQIDEQNITQSGNFQVVDLQGIVPSGIAVENGVAFVVAEKFAPAPPKYFFIWLAFSGVETFNLTNFRPSDQVPSGTRITQQLIYFGNYVFNKFRCVPNGMRAFNGNLYIACACKKAIFSISRTILNSALT